MPKFIELSLKTAAESPTKTISKGLAEDVLGLGREYGLEGYPRVAVDATGLTPEAKNRLELILEIFNKGYEAGLIARNNRKP